MIDFSTSSCCASLTSCFGCAESKRILSPLLYEDVKIFFQNQAPHLDIPLKSKEILGWRTRAKLAVRGVEDKPEIGLFQQGTHRIVSLPNCPLHHPSINRAYLIIYDTLVQQRIVPYCEESHSGLVRYLQFVVERKTRRVQLTIVVTKEDPLLDKWVKRLYIEGGFHSIWFNYQSQATNTVFGKKWKFMVGEPYVQEKMADVDFYFHPACFMQAHLSLFEELVRSVQRHILKDKHVLDLYAGVGVIGLNCLHSAKSVTCVEWSPFAEECFTLSLLKHPIALQKKAVFFQSAVEKYIAAIQQAEVIIVDPPRKGLDSSVLQGIISSIHAEQIIYISCNPHSFFRDCLALIEKGWSITHAETYLLFPGSDHVELLCVLEKGSM